MLVYICISFPALEPERYPTLYGGSVRGSQRTWLGANVHAALLYITSNFPQNIHLCLTTFIPCLHLPTLIYLVACISYYVYILSYGIYSLLHLYYMVLS